MTQMDYFSRVSTEDYVATSFTSTECGKNMIKWVKKPVGRSRKHPLELSETQADKEKVQTHLTQETVNERAPIVLFRFARLPFCCS